MILTTETEIALAVYALIVFRWFYVINKYQKDILSDNETYQFKDHFVFKTILFMRALVLAMIAPLMAFVKPSYFTQFFEGVKVEGRTGIVLGLTSIRRAD
jgi:hypothetical protein